MKKTLNSTFFIDIILQSLLFGIILNFIFQIMRDNSLPSGSMIPQPIQQSFFAMIAIMCIAMYVSSGGKKFFNYNMSWDEIRPEECFETIDYFTFPFRWLFNFATYLLSNIITFTFFISVLTAPGLLIYLIIKPNVSPNETDKIVFVLLTSIVCMITLRCVYKKLESRTPQTT